MKLRRDFVRDGETVTVTAERLEGELWRVRVGENTFEVQAQPLGDGGVRITRQGDDSTSASIAYGVSVGKQFMLRIDGRTHTLSAPAGRGRAGGSGDGTIIAPMTGTVLDVLCQPGDEVEADQTLVVLSAMKMEHKLAAGVAGRVQAVDATTGATVDQGAALVVVEAQQENES